jgi:hypothetical protein
METEMEKMKKIIKQQRRSIEAYELVLKMNGGVVDGNGEPGVVTQEPALPHRCQYCSKLFASFAFLVAHHGRRHPSLPTPAPPRGGGGGGGGGGGVSFQSPAGAGESASQALAAAPAPGPYAAPSPAQVKQQYQAAMASSMSGGGGTHRFTSDTVVATTVVGGGGQGGAAVGALRDLITGETDRLRRVEVELRAELEARMAQEREQKLAAEARLREMQKENELALERGLAQIQAALARGLADLRQAPAPQQPMQQAPQVVIRGGLGNLVDDEDEELRRRRMREEFEREMDALRRDRDRAFAEQQAELERLRLLAAREHDQAERARLEAEEERRRRLKEEEDRRRQLLEDEERRRLAALRRAENTTTTTTTTTNSAPRPEVRPPSPVRAPEPDDDGPVSEPDWDPHYRMPLRYAPIPERPYILTRFDHSLGAVNAKRGSVLDGLTNQFVDLRAPVDDADMDAGTFASLMAAATERRRSDRGFDRQASAVERRVDEWVKAYGPVDTDSAFVSRDDYGHALATANNSNNHQKENSHQQAQQQQQVYRTAPTVGQARMIPTSATTGYPAAAAAAAASSPMPSKATWSQPPSAAAASYSRAADPEDVIAGPTRTEYQPPVRSGPVARPGDPSHAGRAPISHTKTSTTTTTVSQNPQGGRSMVVAELSDSEEDEDDDIFARPAATGAAKKGDWGAVASGAAAQGAERAAARQSSNDPPRQAVSSHAAAAPLSPDPRVSESDKEEVRNTTIDNWDDDERSSPVVFHDARSQIQPQQRSSAQTNPVANVKDFSSDEDDIATINL